MYVRRILGRGWEFRGRGGRQWCQTGSHAECLLFLQRKSPTCFNVSVDVYCARRGKKRRYIPSTRLSGLFAHASSICNCSSPCGPHNEISMTPERQFETWQTQYHTEVYGIAAALKMRLSVAKSKNRHFQN